MLTNKIQANKVAILDTGINILLTVLNHQKVQSSILDCELRAVEILHYLSLNSSAKCLVQNKHSINTDFKKRSQETSKQIKGKKSADMHRSQTLLAEK